MAHAVDTLGGVVAVTSQHLKFRVIEGSFAHTSKYRVELAHNGKLVATVKQLDAHATTAPKFEPTTVALPPHDAIYDSLLLRVIRKSGAMSVRRKPILYLSFQSRFFPFFLFSSCAFLPLTRESRCSPAGARCR
jgi:hypothetical protein